METINFASAVNFFYNLDELLKEESMGHPMRAKLLMYYESEIQGNFDLMYENDKITNMLKNKLQELKAEEEKYWDEKKSRCTF